MAVKSINNGNLTYSSAVVRGNPTNHDFYVRDEGITEFTAAQLSLMYDVNELPVGLGTGVSIDSTGAYLVDPDDGRAFYAFLVVNAGTNDIHAGVNATTDSNMTIANGLTIAAGDSYEFGRSGEAIRNVWAIADSGNTETVQGYSTSFPNGH